MGEGGPLSPVFDPSFVPHQTKFRGGGGEGAKFPPVPIVQFGHLPIQAQASPSFSLLAPLSVRESFRLICTVKRSASEHKNETDTMEILDSIFPVKPCGLNNDFFVTPPPTFIIKLNASHSQIECHTNNTHIAVEVSYVSHDEVSFRSPSLQKWSVRLSCVFVGLLGFGFV